MALHNGSHLQDDLQFRSDHGCCSNDDSPQKLVHRSPYAAVRTMWCSAGSPVRCIVADPADLISPASPVDMTEGGRDAIGRPKSSWSNPQVWLPGEAQRAQVQGCREGRW